ncbi:MAG: ABC transporter ATP-binding protein [Flavisolibacter sp.]
MSFLQLSGVSRREEGTFLVRDVSFKQEKNRKLAIAGATGSGKTTLLKMIAGLIQPSEGAVFFEGQKVLGPEERLLPGHPGIAYLSQHFELRNHYRVSEIIAMARQLPEAAVDQICRVCRIDHLLGRWTHQVSGGEKQRIALARLLVTAPRLLLLDEPYSNLDIIHKTVLKTVIDEVADQLGTTCLLVSHEPLDSLSWAEELMVLREGAVVQQAGPEEIYRQPLDEYVAALFGKFNILSPALAKAFSAFTDIEMNRINSFIRPEDFKIVPDEGAGLRAQVTRTVFMGSYHEAELLVAGHRVTVNTGTAALTRGGVAYLSL